MSSEHSCECLCKEFNLFFIMISSAARFYVRCTQRQQQHAAVELLNKLDINVTTHIGEMWQ
jgi:hypothetical protein